MISKHNETVLREILSASKCILNYVCLSCSEEGKNLEKGLVTLSKKVTDILDKGVLTHDDIVMKDRKGKKTTEERVNHPSHYTWLKELCGIEVIDITRHLDFDKGNAVKYLLRSGYKQESGLSSIEKEIEDLKKAKWYIEDKINILRSKYEKCSTGNKD